MSWQYSSGILVVTRFTILLLLWTENIGRVELIPFSSINDAISYSTEIFIKMASFMVLVYGPEFDLLRIFNFFCLQVLSQEKHIWQCISFCPRCMSIIPSSRTTHLKVQTKRAKMLISFKLATNQVCSWLLSNVVF